MLSFFFYKKLNFYRPPGDIVRMFCDTSKADEWITVLDLQDNYNIEVKEWEHHYGKEYFVSQIFKIILEMRVVKTEDDDKTSVVPWDDTIQKRFDELVDSFQVLDKFFDIFKV